MVITIDGPAGTGKSTVAQALAQRLRFDFLDTGAMYRAVGLEALRRNVNLEDARELTFVARHSRIDFDWAEHPPTVLLNGDAVGHLLRGGDATRAASYVAVVPPIREMLVAQQQRIGVERKNLVTEGRDQGTIVFPKAEFKFYLDATPQERAKRRAAQLRSRGEIVDIADILEQIVARDTRDKSRAIGPLSIPDDAEVIDTTSMSEAQVVDHMVARIKLRRAAMSGADDPSASVVPTPALYDGGRIICRIYTSLFHDLKVYGVANVPRRGGVIIASNHQSNLDPVVIGCQLRRPLSFMAKSELFENPRFGWLIRNLNAFPVRQGEGDIGAVRETIRLLQEGHAISIYPEGTRSRDGEMLALEKGIGLIVKRAGVPVVPTVVDGSFDAMPPGSRFLRPVPIRVMFGPAMQLADLKAAQIVAKIDATLRSMFTDLRRREPVLEIARRRRHGR